ncbi:MAG: F0F1 ATP synthase subunit A [Fimbriimonas ginsengisoli]|nr:F0F1 ATP synthase subunit A [Fimbriimonas ginsengisoli]
MSYAKKGLNERVFKNPITQGFEQVYLFIENMCVVIIGNHGRKYVPMVMVLWLVIFTGNIVALFLGESPTADLSFNFAMALIAVGYVQYEGVRANGLFGHVKHFAGPKLGGVLVIISGLIFVVELISEVLKNVSLSLRLFGNIHGGHVAVESMNKLGEPILVPYGMFLLPIKLLTCVVQAMIFTLLTCVYISLVTHHEEGHGERHAPAAAH